MVSDFALMRAGALLLTQRLAASSPRVKFRVACTPRRHYARHDYEGEE
jgi:hypothetical protein